MGKKKRKKLSRKAKRKKDAEFLQHISMLARTGASLRESAEALGMTIEEIEGLFRRRKKILETWRKSRLNLILGIRASLAKSAAEGKLPAIERLLEELGKVEIVQKAATAVDFEHLKTGELCLALGRQRQTVDRWRTNHGLRRDGNKTYSLPVFFDWFENFCRTKYSSSSDTGGDSLRNIKAEQIALEISRHRKELLDRDRVVTGQISWAQNLVTFCDRGADEISRLCQNQPREKIAEIMRGWFRELHLYTSTVPKHLELPSSMERELESFLGRLKPHDYSKTEIQDLPSAGDQK